MFTQQHEQHLKLSVVKIGFSLSTLIHQITYTYIAVAKWKLYFLFHMLQLQLQQLLSMRNISSFRVVELAAFKGLQHLNLLQFSTL